MSTSDQPCWLSPRVVLYPSGQPAPALPDGGLALAQLPSQVFGDGSHPTTRLCAGAVDFLSRHHRAPQVLDVGTGTGVLARIARARGARFVAATDVDIEALEVAGRHVELDAHPVKIVLENCAPDRWGARFDLVVANILEQPLRQLAPALVSALAPDGQLLLSGFTAAQTPGLRACYQELGLRVVSDASLDGWVMLQLERAAASVSAQSE